MTRHDFDCLMRIRESGVCNMFEVNNVQRAAHDMGFCSLVLWIEAHKQEYFNMLLTGKVVYNPDGDEQD